MKRVLIVITCIFPHWAWSQEGWEGAFAQAESFYESNEIATAIQTGQKALLLAKDEFGYNSMYYAKTLRLLTLASFAGKNFDAGIDFNRQELTVLDLTGNKKTTEYANALSNLAMLYFEIDSISLAKNYYDSALTIFHEKQEAMPKGYALTTYNLANIHLKTGATQKADSLFLHLIKVYQQTQIQDKYYAGALYNKAMLAGINLLASRQMLEEAVIVFEQEKATQQPEYANALYQLATDNLQQQKYQVADSMFQVLVKWYEQMGDTLNPHYSSALNNSGMILQAEGEAQKASSFLEKAYHNRVHAFEKNSPEYITSLNNLASIYQQTGQANKAETLYQELLTDQNLDMPWQVAMLWDSWATADTEGGKFLLANEKLRKAQSIYFSNIQHENRSQIEPRYAITLYNLGQNYQSLGLYDSAQLYFTKALTLNEQLLGKNNVTYVSLLAGLAALYQDMGKFTEAQSAYTEALEIQAQISGKETNSYASILSNYALLYQELGAYQQAENLFRKALLIKRTILGIDHVEYMATLSNLGLLYVKTGEYQLAAPLLEKSLNFYQIHTQDYRSEAAISLINLAELKQAMGKYTEAEPLLKKAISLRKEIYGTEHPAYADAINGLALFYQTMGNYPAAEPMLIDAREIYRHRYGTFHPDYAALTQNLATLYQITGNKEKTEALLIEAIQIDKQILGEKHPNYAIVLSNLAFHYEDQGKFQQAEALLSEALAVNESTFGTQHPAYANSLYNLAALYSEMNRLDTAQIIFKNVIDIREKIVGTNHPAYAQALYGLAVLHHKKGNYREAYPLFKEVIDKYTKQIRDYFPALSEKEKSAFYRRIEPVIEAYKSFAIELVQQSDFSDDLLSLKDSVTAELYNTQLTTKALLLDASSKVRKQILNSGDENLKRLFENWTMKKEYLVRLYSKSPEELQKEDIDIQELEQRANEIEKELSARSTLFSRNIDSQQPSWKDVQNTLKGDEVAIEIIRIGQNSRRDSVVYAALVLDSLSFPQLAIFPNGERLEKRYFNYYRNSVNYRVNDTLSYTYYWKPICEHLSPYTKTIYLSPDGIFNKVNLHVLLNPKTNSYVLDTYAIRLLSSTRDLLTNYNSSEQINNQAYLFGFPTYNLENTTIKQITDTTKITEQLESTPFLNQLKMLPGTRIEVNNIYKLLKDHGWAAKKYLAQTAREEKVKNIREPKLLHIATHGFFLSDLEVDEKTEQKAYGIHLDNIKANPLLRSGLHFAGASNTISGYANAPTDIISALEEGDGILTAYEVMNMDLDGTDLVVLSACETGLGEIRNGEGVYGLQRAFLVAGAQSIIMSLWRVDDEATQKLMQFFYERWVSGEDKYVAFIQALRTLKTEYPEPYYWGGFVMAGK